MKPIFLALAASAAFVATPVQAKDTTSEAALKWEYAYLGLSAVDLAQTIYVVESGKGTESNPLFGKHPKTWVLVAAKVGGSALQFALFNETRKKDPKLALRIAQVSVLAQGTVVGLNMRVVF